MKNRGCVIYWRLVKLLIILVQLVPGGIDTRSIVARLRPIQSLELGFLERCEKEFVGNGYLPNAPVLCLNPSLAEPGLTIPFKPQKTRFEHAEYIFEPTQRIPICVGKKILFLKTRRKRFGRPRSGSFLARLYSYVNELLKVPSELDRSLDHVILREPTGTVIKDHVKGTGEGM
jgi:hypothetical protein